MGLFDIILIIIIAGFGLFGLWFGLIHTLGSLSGTLVGAFLASRIYAPAADVLAGITSWSGNACKVIMFIVILIIINRLIGLLFWFFEKTFGIAARLPFLKSLNKFLGMMFGLFEGIITIGLVIYFLDLMPVSGNIQGIINASVISPYCLSVAAILMPLLPEGLKIFEKGVDKAEEILL